MVVGGSPMRAAILSRRCCEDARVCALLRKLCEQGHPIGHTVVRHSRGLGIARSRWWRVARSPRLQPEVFVFRDAKRLLQHYPLNNGQAVQSTLAKLTRNHD